MKEVSQLIFTCSESTIETLEKGVKNVQSKNKNSSVFIFNFEHVSYFFQVLLLFTLNM